MMLRFFNAVVNDVESNTKKDNYVIIASLKSEPTSKLINTRVATKFASFGIKFTRLGFERAC